MEGQTHWPVAEQIPAPEHDGEQLVDWISKRVSADEREIWDTSGTESQRIVRPSLLVEETATQTLSDSAIDLAPIGREMLLTADVGSPENAS